MTALGGLFLIASVTSIYANPLFPSCVCRSCEEPETVGIAYKEFCYYANVNDRLYSNNDRVDQFDVSHVVGDIDVADGLIALVTKKLYDKFRHPFVNIRPYKSRFFKQTTDSECLKLNIRTNAITRGGCKPEVQS